MRVLADPEAQVPAGLVGAEVRLALDVGQVRLGQVGGAAEQLGQPRRERLDRVLAGVAGRDLGAGLVRLEVRVPAVGQAPGRSGGGTRAPRPGRPPRSARTAHSQSVDQRLAGRDRRAEVVARRVRARRTSGPGPSRRPPWSGGPRRVRAASRAPSGCRACSGCRSRCASGRRSGSGGRRRGPPRSPPRWRRCRCRPRPAGCASRRPRSASGRPPTRPSTSARRAGRGCRRTGRSSLPEPQVAGEAGRLRRDALLEVAVRGDDVRPVVDDRARRAG